MSRNPAENETGDTVDGVEDPRFAAHLPSGKLLDWAWERQRGKRNRFNATPGLDAVQRAWDGLGDDDVANLATHSDDPDVLDWVARNGARRTGVRSALLRNGRLRYETLVELLERGTSGAERDGIVGTRSNQELCRLLLAGHPFAGNPRHVVGWIVGSACGGHLEADELASLIAVLDVSHHSALLAELLRAEHDGQGFPLDPVLDLLEGDAGNDVHPNGWRSLGAHLAQRGTARQIRRALAATDSASLRAALVSARRLTLAQAFAKHGNEHRLAVLQQLAEDRLIDTDEAPLVASVIESAAGGNLGGNSAAARSARGLLHNLRYEPAAVHWLTANGSPTVAGTVVWHTDSDAALLSALRRNTESHRLAGAHIWRVGRVWDRLSTRTRTSIVATFDVLLLNNLAPGPVRDWIVACGPVSAVNGLTLKKTEQRSLMDRVEKERDPELAWVAARIAERPRDRVRMAEIGMLGETWESGIRNWLRGATSSEIVKLWGAAGARHGNQLGKLLVANLRASEETSWLDRLVAELRIEWQDAPTPVQQAAAHWLSGRCGSDPDTWSAIWSLYPEWTGTLPELVDAASNI
ncbi:MAG: hypothetical protein KJS90_04680 [Acidobacteria bacterium]|nr:hypothetical protein [Acidobacteriota bacterium]